jgi:hypothetical protein
MTVDFAADASQNSVSITQQKWQIMIFFQDCSIMNAESNNLSNVFCHSLNNIGFLMKKKVVSTEFVLRYSRCENHLYVAAAA